MSIDYKVVVVRHPRENPQKCSLRGLHNHPNFEFYKAIDGFSFDATGYLLLEMDAPAISEVDAHMPILLLDSTWALLPRVRGKVYGKPIARSLPPSILTAYPRKSKMFEDPSGLATLEALYAALRATGIKDPEILRGYMFAKRFLDLNGWADDVSENFFDGAHQVL